MRNTHFFMSLTVFALLATAFPLGVCSAQASDAPEQASQGTKIERALDNPVGVVFEQIHVQDVLEFITDTYAINIIVDNRVVRPKDLNKVDPDAKYVTDGVISYVNLQNVTLREALKAVLRPLGLTYSVQRSFIWISTAEHLRHETFEELETRFYSLQSGQVQNLNADMEGVALEPIHMVNLLRHVVPEIVEPVTEELLSFVRFNEKTNALVVHNTPSNHRIVEQVLRLLDKPI